MAQPGGLGRLQPPNLDHVARFPLSAVLPPTAPFVAETRNDPRFDVWSVADADQGQTSRCVGFAGQRCKVVLDGVDFDPDWLWRQAKLRDGFGDVNADRGTTVHAAMQVLLSLGDVRVKGGADLPADPAYGILSAHWANTVDEIRQCHVNHIPVDIGIDWGTGYDDVTTHNGERWIGRSGFGSQRGGHSVTLINSSDQRQAFELVNNWGIPPVWIPYSELEARLNDGGEAAIITDRPGPGPDVQPTPTPKPKPGRIPKDAVSARPLTLLSVLNQGATTVVLEDGVYFPLHLSQMSGIALYARHVGKVAFRSGVADDRGPSVSLRFESCEGITLDGIGLANAGCGLRATDCKGFTLRRVYSHHHTVEGILFGTQDGFTLEDCEEWACRGQYEGEWGKSHGVYVSYGSRNGVIRRNYAHGCGGDAIHVNGKESESGSPAENVLIEDCRGLNCGIGGGAGIEISSARNVTARRTTLTWDATCPETGDLSAANAGGVTCYAGDEGGPARDVLLEDVTVRGAHRYGVQVLDGSTVTVKDCHVSAKQNVRDVDGSSTLTDGGGNTWEQV